MKTSSLRLAARVSVAFETLLPPYSSASRFCCCGVVVVAENRALVRVAEIAGRLVNRSLTSSRSLAWELAITIAMPASTANVSAAAMPKMSFEWRLDI